MTVTEKMQSMLADFSKNERRIADHILKYPNDLKRYSAVSIAEVCDVSRSAVIRFCQKLGFTGYSDFQKAYLAEMENAVSERAAVSGALDVYKSCIEQLQMNTDQAELNAVSEMITHSRRILCFGIDHSGYSAKQMAFRLVRHGIDASYISDDSTLMSYVKQCGPGDSVIIFSISGQKRLCESLEQFHANRTGIILFTMNANTSLRKTVDHMLVIPSAVHFDSPYLLDDMPCFLLGIEMVMESIQKKLKMKK